MYIYQVELRIFIFDLFLFCCCEQRLTSRYIGIIFDNNMAEQMNRITNRTHNRYSFVQGSLQLYSSGCSSVKFSQRNSALILHQYSNEVQLVDVAVLGPPSRGRSIIIFNPITRQLTITVFSTRDSIFFLASLEHWVFCTKSLVTHPYNPTS